MNRRNFAKIVGAFIATTTTTYGGLSSLEPDRSKPQWLIELEPQADTLLKKWHVILDYTSKDVPALPKEKWVAVACEMEYRERQFINMPRGKSALLFIIPQIRIQQGNVNIKVVTEGGKQAVHIYNPTMFDDTPDILKRSRYYGKALIISPNDILFWLE